MSVVAATTGGRQTGVLRMSGLRVANGACDQDVCGDQAGVHGCPPFLEPFLNLPEWTEGCFGSIVLSIQSCDKRSTVGRLLVPQP